jgi:3-dehydroquinate synthase
MTKPVETIEVSQSMVSRVRFGRNVLPKWLKAIDRPLVVLADRQAAQWVRQSWDAVPERLRVGFFELDVSEAEKNLHTVDRLYQNLSQGGVTRDTVLVAVGGGVLSDVAGYVAATYLRGLPWIAVPTTLLAQVDAAIGGKVGVNTEWGKNLVGAFHLPQDVVVDVQTLSSLPVDQWRAGLGEVIKSALIAPDPLFSLLDGEQLALGQPNDAWQHVIQETAMVKIRIVREDLFESGPRMYLNFGHTVGHALERTLGYGRLLHGEAVAIGSLIALRLSEQRLGLDPGVRENTVRWLKRWHLPTQWPSMASPDAVWEAVFADKKARRGGVNWVLLAKVGQPQIVSHITREEFDQAVRSLQASG